MGIIFLAIAGIMFSMFKIYDRCEQYGYGQTCYNYEAMCCPASVDCSQMDFSSCQKAKNVLGSA